jgi:nitric oxide synthase-interacting protein
MENILSQRQEIKRLEREMEKGKDEEKEQEERDDEAARERAIRDFELVQMGLNVKNGANNVIVGREGGKVLVEEQHEGAKKGVKRKFELDEEELLRIAKEERTKYKKELDDEKVCLFPSPLLYYSPDTNDDTESLSNTSPLILGPIPNPRLHNSNECKPCDNQGPQTHSTLPIL